MSRTHGLNSAERYFLIKKCKKISERSVVISLEMASAIDDDEDSLTVILAIALLLHVLFKKTDIAEEIFLWILKSRETIFEKKENKNEQVTDNE